MTANQGLVHLFFSVLFSDSLVQKHPIRQVHIHYQMFEKVFHNATFFPHQKAHCISGAIPNDIRGRYFRNGSSTQSYDSKNILTHWFGGCGGLLKLEFKEGECYCQFSEVDTPMSRERKQERTFREFFLTNVLRQRQQKDGRNPANTNVHPMKEGPHVLALCEGGSPYVVNKSDLAMLGFNDYGWIKEGFSAHPKVDPQNGDIFNIGTNFTNATVTISQSDMHLKLKQSTEFKLRQRQSVHDFCLAGDYLVIFECSIGLSLWKLITESPLSGLFNFNRSIPVLVHVYSKKDLTLVKQFEMEPFMVFHFSNGYSNEKEIVVQYCRYDADEAEPFFQFLRYVPKYSQGFKKEFSVRSHLEELRIDLHTFKTTTRRQNLSVEFPVVHDQLVGRQWETTYMTHSSGNNFILDTLAAYNRNTREWTLNKLGDDAYINEPVIIPGDEQDYLLGIVNRDGHSYAEIFHSNTLERMCQIRLPESVPAGFHGKWDNQL